MINTIFLMTRPGEWAELRQHCKKTWSTKEIKPALEATKRRIKAVEYSVITNADLGILTQIPKEVGKEITVIIKWYTWRNDNIHGRYIKVFQKKILR